MSWATGASIHEIRRSAPLHFFFRAENARLVAYVLWASRDKPEKGAVKNIGYGGTPSVAKIEGFYREASIALELIIKAVIAGRIQRDESGRPLGKVPTTHNLPELWLEAGLPKLTKEDHHRLLIAKSTLLWSGRYPAPKSDKLYDREYAEMRKFETTTKIGKLKIIEPRSFSFDDIDRIYQIAAEGFSATELHVGSQS